MKKAFFLSGFLCMLLLMARAKVVLPSVFSDNMVLQQKTNAAVWGKATPGKTVTVLPSWNGKTYTVPVDVSGNWNIKLPTPSYGGPYTIRISDGEPLVLKNVLIGEVWICSGQSNMEMPLAGWGKINNYEKEIAAADYPNIRLLQAIHATSNQPLDDAQVSNGGWQPCSPQTVGEFSSVAYFFAREIYTHTKIPIGLIHTSWGGTVAEAWTSGATLKTLPDFKAAATAIENTPETSAAEMTRRMEAWQKGIDEKDAGYRNGEAAWLSNTDESGWQTMELPSFWEARGLPDFDGVVWFKKKINIPQSWAGKDITVSLGMIDDNDISWFNGEKIGATVGYTTPRKYTISGSKVKAGENSITVRVFDGGGGGGIYGEPATLALESASGERLSLAGPWLYKVGLNLKDLGPAPESATGPNRATVLYNAMIHPYIRFAIRGAIWYQGEANADRAWQYRSLFPALITDWRKQWGIGDFPFYFVQLANFMKAEVQPMPSAWAELREAQSTTLSLPNTGMAVIIDIGDADNIHPKNKQEVGRRLALIALAKNYGEKLVYTGPVFQSQKIGGNTIRLAFKTAGGQLTTGNNKPLTGFAIAGADHVFHWANASIENNQVVVSSPGVSS
ncbi:MAG TPA: sialate O-acetylesterase, partial [Chitinophagaceae bacterium]